MYPSFMLRRDAYGLLLLDLEKNYPPQYKKALTEFLQKKKNTDKTNLLDLKGLTIKINKDLSYRCSMY